jgi:hypothetical protein
MNAPLRVVLIAALLLTAARSAQSQGEAAVPFLLLPVSPETNGMGGITSAFISEHPFAPSSNPAQLGLFSLTNFVSAGTFLQETNVSSWLGLEIPRYRALAFNAGLNLHEYTGLPLGVGLGYSRIHLDLGKFVVSGPSGPEPIGTVESYETADNISLAIGIDTGVKIGAGASIKFINSHLGAIGSESEVGEASASVTGYDIGLLVKVPVIDLAARAGANLAIPSLHVAPLLDLTLGYSKRNLGNEVTYVDPNQADPLPRTALLGAGIEAGIVSTLVPDGWRLLSGGLYREAGDLLVLRHNDGTWEYTGGVGDVDLIDNVIAGKPGSTITQRKGWQIDVAEFVSFRGGSVHEPYVEYTTTGFALKLGGLLKALSTFTPEDKAPWVDLLMENLDVRYDWSELEYGPGRGSVGYSSLCVILKRIPF